MEHKSNSKLAFGKRNYLLMIIGIVVLLLGFIIMSLDNERFGFGFMGLTLGPLVVFAGFMIQFFALLHKPKQ